ncbi:MAG: lysozyme inhibitor LprI family protein [Acetobacteraceae bacterium]
MNGVVPRKTGVSRWVRAARMLVVASAVPLMAAPGAARAAARFDCAKATTPIEKPICGDPSLSGLDGRMAPLFRQRLDPADPAMRRDQRQWLLSQLRSCAIAATGHGDPSPALRGKAVPCLRDLYRNRLAALTASHPGMDTPIRLVAGHPLKPGWMPLPRIVDPKGHPALERINRALALADTKDADDDCITRRDVNTTLVGRRYLSLVVNTVSQCAGAAEIDLGTEVLGFDLKTGAPVDWATMLPPSFHGSDAETELYRETLTRSDPEDAKECADFSFDTLDLWPDARHGGVAFQPAGSFPASTEQCIISAVVPLTTMRKLGANPTVLDDISHAAAAPPR